MGKLSENEGEKQYSRPPSPGSAIRGAFFMSDQYGLESNFKFAASNSSFSQMDRVIALLEGIEKATKETAHSIASTSLGKDLIKSLNADGVKRESKAMQGAVKAITNTLSPLKSEFRALRAESRNIDFGEMTDTTQFKKASTEIDRYIKKLKALESQVSGDSTGDREFKAGLQSQQRVAGDKVKLAKASRNAGLASERLGFAQSIQGAGQGVLNVFAEPLAAAGELQKSFAGVKKLADGLSAAGTRTLQNEVFNLSSKLAIEDTKVSAVFEDLAGSGKNFGDTMSGVGSRIAEVEQILKNQQGLDISSEAATQLDITLGSIYKNLVSKDPGAIIELNARAASSINELADKLSDVRISAEDVIPVMNVVMNTVGDSANFPVHRIAAYSAAIAALGTIEPEAAGSFFNRLSAKMSDHTDLFANALGMTVENFGIALNTDKLGVVTKLAEAYKNVQGGELAKGAFFSSIKIGSVQDQKLLQGLANNLTVLKEGMVVAEAGFTGREVNESIDATGKKTMVLGEQLKNLSIDNEIAKVMQNADFQTERFTSSLKSLMDTLGLSGLDLITPFKTLASDVIGIFLKFTQAAPGLTKVLVGLTYGFGTLAAAIGGVGIALFTFQQAQAIAATAAITMQSSLIPLTGFFQTAMTGFSGTFPWTNVLKQSTVMADELAVAATGAQGVITGELRTGLIALRSQVMLTGQAALGMARAFMMSPLGIAVGVILLLDQVLQQANPKVRLLGTLFSIVSSAAGFAFGIVEGFVSAFLKLLNVPVSAAGGLLASPFKAITEALDFAMTSFRNWERSGKHIGETIFNVMAMPFMMAASATANAWDKTIGFISGLLRPLADLAAYIGYFIQGSLSEHSPGTTWWIRLNWAFTAVKVGASMLLMQIASMITSAKIREFMGAAAAWVVTTWQTSVQKVSDFFATLTLPESLNDFATEIGNAWANTFGMMTTGWSNFVSTFTSTTPDFAGLGLAGMTAMGSVASLASIGSLSGDMIQQAMGATASSVTTIWQTTVEKVNSFFATLTLPESLNDFAREIGNAWANTFGMMTSGWSNFVSTFASATPDIAGLGLAGMTAMGATASSSVTTTWQTTVEKVNSFFATLALPETLTNFATELGNAWANTFGMMTTGWSNFVSTFTSATPDITGLGLAGMTAMGATASFSGDMIQQAMGATASSVTTTWQTTVEKVNSFFATLTLPESLNDFAREIGNAWANTFGMMTAGWSNFVSTFASTTPDFAGLGLAGMTAMGSVASLGSFSGDTIQQAMGATASSVTTTWQTTVEKVNSFFATLALPETLTNFATELGNVWSNTFGAMTSGWLNFVTTFTSATPDFAGLAFAGMAAMKPLLAWGLPDIVSEKFDSIIAPKTQSTIAPQVVEPLRQQSTTPQITEQLTTPPPQTENLWERMWGRIVDLSGQAGDRIMGVITQTFGTKFVEFATKIATIISTTFQNASNSFQQFAGEGVENGSTWAGIGAALFEVAKGALELSNAFMGMDRLVFDNAIKGFNLLGFAALTAATMLMTLVTVPFEALKKLPLYFGTIIGGITSIFGVPNQVLLEQGASKYVEFLKVFDRPGIGTALAKGLPGIIAVLMSMNVFEDWTQMANATLTAWANNLPQVLSGMLDSGVPLFNWLSIGDVTREQVDSTLAEIGALFGTFFQNLGASAVNVQNFIRPIFEAIASAKVLTIPQFFADYMGFGEAMQPLTDFVHNFPLLGIPIAEFIVIEAALSGVVDLLKSPSFAGFVGYLRGPLFNAVRAIGGVFFNVFRAIVVSIAGIPILLVKTAIANSVKAVGALQASLFEPVLQGVATVRTLIVEQASSIFAAIGGGFLRFLAFLRTIPVVGNLIASVLETTILGVAGLLTLAQQALPAYLQSVSNQLNLVWASVKNLIPAFAALGGGLVVGAKYIINEAFKPLAQAIGFLMSGGINDLYIKTKGMQGVTKGVNPIDVGVSMMDDALVQLQARAGLFRDLEGKALEGVAKAQAMGASRPIRNWMMGIWQTYEVSAKEVAAKVVTASGQVGGAVTGAVEELFPISILGGKLKKVRSAYLGAVDVARLSKGYERSFSIGWFNEGMVMFKMVAPSVVQLLGRVAFAWMTYYTVLDAIKPALLGNIDAFAKTHTELGIFANLIYIFTGAIRILRFLLVDSVNAFGAFAVSLFKSSAVIAPIVGAAAGIIAQGIGLMIKGVILGAQSLGAIFLGIVTGVSKMMQAVLISIRYEGQKIREMFTSTFKTIFDDYFKSLSSDDVSGRLIGLLWAATRIVVFVLPFIIGGIFVGAGRILIGSILLFGRLLLSNVQDALGFFITSIVPYTIKTSLAIGSAIIQGIVAGVQGGIKNITSAIDSIGRALSEHPDTGRQIAGLSVFLGFFGYIIFAAAKAQLAANALVGGSITSLGASVARVGATASLSFLPWAIALSGVGFLVYEVWTGFKELDGIIAALNNPVQWLQDSLSGIAKTFATGVETGGIAFVVEKLIRILPIALGAIFLIGFAVKKHIFGGFMLIWDVVKGIANSLINVIRAAKSIPNAVVGIGTEGRILEGVHKVRSGLNLYRNPQAKEARGDEFKLAKESAMFLQKIQLKSKAEIIALAQMQATDYGHMAKQVETKKGGFFGIGARKQKEWQLTGAGEEFRRKRLAETHEAKVGVFDDQSMKAIAKAVSPARLGLMQGEDLRAIFAKDRPDLTALGNALEMVKVQNVAVMNVDRVNGMASDNAGQIGKIQYDRAQLNKLKLTNLPGNKETYSLNELRADQLSIALGAANVKSKQRTGPEGAAGLSAQAKKDTTQLMRYQLATATERIDNGPARSVVGADFLQKQLALTGNMRTSLASGNNAGLSTMIDNAIGAIQAESSEGLAGFNFQSMLEELSGVTDAGKYESKLKTYIERMMKEQLEAVENAFNDSPDFLEVGRSGIGGVTNNVSTNISRGLGGIFSDIIGGIKQAVVNTTKKFSRQTEGFSSETLSAINRKVSGVTPLADQRQQDSRRSKLEMYQRQLREDNLSSTKQHQVLQKMADLLQKDVYELTNPLMEAGLLNSQLERAKAERAKIFNTTQGGNAAFEKWIGKFTGEQQTAIVKQLQKGQFKGGALNTTSTQTYRDAGGEKTREVSTNHEIALARALGHETIAQVEQAFSTETVLSSAKQGWKDQLRRLVGIDEEADFYNNQIDALRIQINQRVERQATGFTERESRRTAAAEGRESGFVAHLRRTTMNRQQFMARLDADQQTAFDGFLATGKLQSKRPDNQYEQMKDLLGFDNVDMVKEFQKELAKGGNEDVFAHIKAALETNPMLLNRSSTAEGMRLTNKLKEIMRNVGKTVSGTDEAGQLLANRSFNIFEQLKARLRDPNTDQQALLHAIEFMETGADSTNMTVDQIAAIGRHMDMQGTPEQIASQLRSIANQRTSGFGSISESFRMFVGNLETDAKSVEQWISNRLTDVATWSFMGGTPLAGIVTALRNNLFEPITALVKGTWTWLGTTVKELGTGAVALKEKAGRMLTSLPGVRTFAAARQRREADSGTSLQTLSSKMGYTNQEEFAQKFKDVMIAKGITDSRIQNKALQAILNSNSKIGVAESLRTSRSQEIVDHSTAIGESLAETLGMAGTPQQIAKLLMPGGFTARALAPMRNYLLRAVFPAIWDVASTPLKAIVQALTNPRQTLNTVKSAAARVADTVSDFMVDSYTNIRKIFTAATTQLGRVPLFTAIWGAVSGFFGKIGARIQGMVVPTASRQLRRLQDQRQYREVESIGRNALDRNLASAREGNFPPEQLPDSSQIGTHLSQAEPLRLEAGQRDTTIATLSEVRTQAISRLNPFQKLLVQATNAASATKRAWAQTAEEISETGWRGLVARFKRIGYLMQRNISEGSPGPSANTRANWEHTQEAVSANMGEMAASAQVAGQQIQGDMQRTARRSVGFFGALHGAVSGAGKAGMAVGGAITAVGFAAQTASYSLVNMGLLDETSAAKLNKFLEIFTLVGAVGGLMAPVMGAIVSSVTAIGGAFALIFNPVTLTMGVIAAGLWLANEGLKRFAGIDLLGPIMTNVQGPITGAIAFVQEKIDQVFAWLNDKFGTKLSPILDPLGAAVATIQGAWQGFVDWFVAMPLVQTAIDIGTGLINALNHNPTEKIPLAWEGAIESIKGMLFGLPFVGDLIAGLMKDALDPTKILGNLFEGFHSMLDQLESSGLARFGGGKLLDGLKGFLGGFGKKKAEVATEIPVEAGVKLNYKDALDSAIRQADFDARSGSATAQAASTNLQYQRQATGGQMDANQLGTTYQGAGGEFLQQAIAKQNNRLFTDQGGIAKERRGAIDQELQTLNQKEVELQSSYVQALEKVQVAATAPAPTNFLEGLFAGGSNNVNSLNLQAVAASQAMTDLQSKRDALQKKAVESNFVFDAGTDQMLKNMGVDPDGLIVAVAEAKAAISTGITEVGFVISDRWNYLERSNGGNLSAMMETDLQKAGGAFRVLKGDVVDFAQKAATSLQKMDWAGFTEASGDFWNNLKVSLGQATSGFAGAGLSAIMFYVHLSPIAFILGAVALAGLAIATNFLGMRSILMGIIRVFTGFAQVAVSSVMMVMNVIRGLVKIVGGIPAAINGDFRQMGEGLEVVWSGIKEGARGLLRGLASIFGGGLEVLGGLFQGLRQTIGIVFGPALINSAREAVTAIKQLFESAGETITAAIRKPGQVLDGIANRFRKGKQQVAGSPIGRTVGEIAEVSSGKAPNQFLDSIRNRFRKGKEQVADSPISRTVGEVAEVSSGKVPNQVLDGIANRFRNRKQQVADSPIGRTVGEIAEVASGKAPNMDAARVANDFDMKVRGKDPDAQLTAGDRARLAQRQMTSVLSSGADTPRHLGANVPQPTNNRGVLGDIDTELRAAESGLGRMRDRSVSAADAANNALSSLGIALSSFSPALAAPLFMVGDLLSGFTGLSLALPQLGILFPGVTTAITGFTTALSAGTFTVSGAMIGFGTVFTGVMTGISAAASTAWIAISGPLLPLFVLLGALAIGFVLFKTNFMGFGDFISGVFGGVGDALSGIWQTITEGIAEIGSLMSEIGGYLLKPLEPLFQLFGMDTGGGSAGGMQTAVISGAINAALLPIQAIGSVIKGIIWSVFAIVKVVVWLGGLVVKAILAPITLVSNAIALIVRGFQALGSVVSTALMAPFQFLQNAIQWIWERLMQLPAFLGQALASIPFIGPLLQNLGGSLFQSGAQTPVQQFASGGPVIGPGTGNSDSIPALLSNKEFVVSAGPAQANLGLLTALNEGRSLDVLPMPSPTRIPVAAMSSGRSADSESASMQMPPVQINVNLNGDVVLSGGNSAADAQEFLTKIEPYLQQAVWGMFRNWVDFNR